MISTNTRKVFILTLALVLPSNSECNDLSDGYGSDPHFFRKQEQKGIIDYFGFETGMSDTDDGTEAFTRLNFSGSYLRSHMERGKAGVRYREEELIVRLRASHNVTGPEYTDIWLKFPRTSTSYRSDGTIYSESQTVVPMNYRNDEDLGFERLSIWAFEWQHGYVYPFKSSDNTLFVQWALNLMGGANMRRHEDNLDLTGLTYGARAGIGRQRGPFRVYFGIDASFVTGSTQGENPDEPEAKNARLYELKLESSYQVADTLYIYLTASREVVDFRTADDEANSYDEVDRIFGGLRWYPHPKSTQNVLVRHFRDEL